MTATKRDYGNGRTGYEVSIESSEGAPTIPVSTEDLDMAIRELFLLHQQFNTGLNSVTYLIERDTVELRFRVTRSYDN